MNELITRITTLSADEINIVLDAMMNRYGVLYPDWEIQIIAIEKEDNRDEQLNRMISIIERLKK